jgi:2,4-diketo-3-deoxy-L-fuconate hydrolase
MRLCRYRSAGVDRAGFLFDEGVIALNAAAEHYESKQGTAPSLADDDDLLALLPPQGSARETARSLHRHLASISAADRTGLATPLQDTQLLVPVPHPSKIMLLAGNYGKHIEEGGGKAAEREETFPYVFMKPPTTTLTNPGDPIRIPEVSPAHVDWELELGVVIGKTCKGVSEAEALHYVAGYTIVNDISDREFHPNPNRRKRDKDGFFDWLHGKWHDTFCPMGPCILSADDLPDPQTLELKLSVNGEVKQHASTADMIFPVAAIIEFISSYVTLEPGDVISTGTPHGVGAASKTYLKSGDVLEAQIESIGALRNPIH